jgi:hypothetical protein
VSGLTDGPVPENLRDLTIDDLLAPPAGSARLGGHGPYVINLSASSAPLRLPPAGLLNFEHLHVYQVQRKESGQPRFRLRLGPITSELEADALLATVREHYPGALTATAAEDDLRAIAAAAAVKIASNLPSEPVAEERESVAAGPAHKAPQEPASPTNERRTDLTMLVRTLADSPAPARRPASLKLAVEKPSPAVVASPGIARGPTHNSAAPTVNSLTMSGQGGAPHIQLLPDHLATVDSTHTVRALTPLEHADGQSSKWFVAQLALSASGFSPDNVPNLDIFNEYHLYSVVGLDQGRVMHALRLGFFTDDAAAQAVAGYLRCYFEATMVKRVSTAEHERFVDRRITARKDSGPTGVHTVIELSTPPPVPTTRLANLAETANRRGVDEESLRPRTFAPVKR